MVDSGVGKTFFGFKLNMKKIPNHNAFWKFDLADRFYMNTWGSEVKE